MGIRDAFVLSLEKEVWRQRNGGKIWHQSFSIATSETFFRARKIFLIGNRREKYLRDERQNAEWENKCVCWSWSQHIFKQTSSEQFCYFSFVKAICKECSLPPSFDKTWLILGSSNPRTEMCQSITHERESKEMTFPFTIERIFPLVCYRSHVWAMIFLPWIVFTKLKNDGKKYFQRNNFFPV